MKIENRHIYALDFIIIVGTLIGMFFAVGYVTPLVIAPLDGLETYNNSVLFSFDKASIILIDDNIDFTSPQEIFIEDNLIINLKPGTYYWKIENINDVRKFTINSEVSLKVRPGNGNYEVVNAGNTALDVGIYENDELKESIVLGIDESKEVSGTKFIGREYE